MPLCSNEHCFYPLKTLLHTLYSTTRYIYPRLFIFSIFGKSFRRLALFCALGLYALSNHFVANALLSPSEMPYNHPLHVKTDIDAVVVLGGGSMQGVANLPLQVDAYKRMAWGMMLAKNHNLPLLFTGGGLNAEHSGGALAFNDEVLLN